MTILDAIQARHSVRSYKDIQLKPEDIQILQKEIDACNKEGGLHIQLVTNEPKAFDSFMAHYGKFSGVHCTHRKKERRLGGALGLLRGAAGSVGPDTGTEYLLGGYDLWQRGGQESLHHRVRGKAGVRAVPWLRRHTGNRPQE